MIYCSTLGRTNAVEFYTSAVQYLPSAVQLRAVELHDESRCQELEAFLADRICEFNVKATDYADIVYFKRLEGSDGA
jgi:hypothetical protein